MATTLGAFPRPPQPLSITLPTGAMLTGAVDLPKGLDEQCRVAFNLMLQLGPFLASIQCLLQILQFVKDILDVATDVKEKLPKADIAGIVSDIEKVAKDGEKLLGCFGWVAIFPLCTFLKDLLRMVHDFIGCVLELMDSVVQQQLQIQIQTADAQLQGNQELLDVLHLAQANLEATMGQAAQSMGPILTLLQLVGGFLEIVGVGALALPSMDQLTGGAFEESLQVVKDLNDAIGVIIELLPC
jgi:hypothetical protein